MPWTRLSDEKLLELRFCDLKLSLERSPLARRVKRLYAELENRGIHFKPHVWLSTSWFTPDGVSGFAIPFYLWWNFRKSDAPGATFAEWLCAGSSRDGAGGA